MATVTRQSLYLITLLKVLYKKTWSQSTPFTCQILLLEKCSLPSVPVKMLFRLQSTAAPEAQARYIVYVISYFLELSGYFISTYPFLWFISFLALYFLHLLKVGEATLNHNKIYIYRERHIYYNKIYICSSVYMYGYLEHQIWYLTAILWIAFLKIGV